MHAHGPVTQVGDYWQYTGLAHLESPLFASPLGENPLSSPDLADVWSKIIHSLKGQWDHIQDDSRTGREKWSRFLQDWDHSDLFFSAARGGFGGILCRPFTHTPMIQP